jgi:RHS repeat-associated protein
MERRMDHSKNYFANGLRLLGAWLLVACIGMTASAQISAQSSTSTVCYKALPPDGEPPCGQASGNPINVTSGNKFQREVDMPALPGVLGLELVRNYNSASSKLSDAPSMMGKGWRLSYDWTLRFDHAAGNEQITLVQGDGTQEALVKHRVKDSAQRPQWTGKWRPLGPIGGELSEVRTQTGNQYVWAEPSGKLYRFNERGLSISIEVPTGEFLSIKRQENGDIAKVTDPQGRTLQMKLLDDKTALRLKKFGGIQSIDTPVGRYDYAYGGGLPTASSVDPVRLLTRLVSVTHAGIVRHYLFEDAKQPTLLTGIRVIGEGSDRVQMDQRIATWAYDDKGRAVLSMRGGALPTARPVTADRVSHNAQVGEELVRLKFLPPFKTGAGHEFGSTLLTNSLGQKTSYQYRYFAGKPKLIEVLGPGCSSCGASNVRHEYDHAGRLLETLRLAPAKRTGGHRGEEIKAGETLDATRWVYDQNGRPIQKLALAFMNGQAQAPRSILRLEYTDTSGPEKISVIARPSVVPGQEHRINLSYNAFGQITQIVQTGFEPIDSKPISRSTRYRYQSLQGRSVLFEVDGPMPNGPQASPEDSDIRQFAWDAQGSFATQITEPGGVVHKHGVDSAGRLSELLIDDRFRRTQDQYQYTKDGRLALSPEHLKRTAWTLNQQAIASASKLSLELQTRAYDAQGRLSRETESAGRTLHWAYDSANRVTSVSEPKGHRAVSDFDTEGHLLRSGLYRPEQSEPLRAAYFWHDDMGRLSERLLPDGRIDTWQYDRQGALAEHLDGDAVRKLFLKSKDQDLSAVVSMAPDGDLRAQFNSPTNPSSVRDDFGRVVQVNLPDHGKKQFSYDAMGKITQVLHADGSAVQYAYDQRSRLLSKAYLDTNQQRQSEARLTYQGLVLKEARDEEQISVFLHDALGRTIEERIRLQRLAKEFVTQHHYDQHTGLRQARRLFDGQTMQITRTPLVDGATVKALSLQPAWATWLEQKLALHLSSPSLSAVAKRLPRTMIASEIEVDAFNGLSSYVAGNGIKTHREFDRAGRLIALDTQGVNSLRYQYQTGPRIRGIVEVPKTMLFGEALPKEISFDYSGFGALIAPNSAPGSITKVAAVRADIASTDTHKLHAAKPKFDLQGRTIEDERFAYQYSLKGQVSEIQDRKTGATLASYKYNSLGQRVSKTITGGKTTFFLWQDNRIVAEVNQHSDIESQYLYLDEGHQNGTNRATPMAKIESTSNKENPSNAVRVLFVHNDHRGAPIAMTDKSQAVVWKAESSDSVWGRTIDARNSSDDKPLKTNLKSQRKDTLEATLNLRMPGQYFDAETGLHDNFHRTYNPATGRYLQPDPLGYPDGPDTYIYAVGDPINRTDSLGLYAEDVHYYLTYFLARTAGLTSPQALTVAQATQFIDDNFYTEPFHSGTVRMRYHFTYTDTEITAERNSFPLVERFMNAGNAQTKVLRSYAMDATTECAKQQFYGEFLHAYMDTYAHRNEVNVPYGPVGGHVLTRGLPGHAPDTTYDWLERPDIKGAATGNFRFQNEKAIAMEESVFNLLKKDVGRASNFVIGPPLAWTDVRDTLIAFNAIEVSGDIGNFKGLYGGPGKEINLSELAEAKLAVLEKALAKFGFGSIPKYVKESARTARKNNLLDEKGRPFLSVDFPKAILSTD